MARPFAPEGERKDTSLQVRATKEDVDAIKSYVQNIRTSLTVLKKLPDGGKYPAMKTADILKEAVRFYDEALRQELADKINEMS